MSKYKFGLYDQTNGFDEFQKFHNLLFKNTDASPQWFQWFFKNARREELISPRIYTLRDGDRLIGSWCVEPKHFLHNGWLLRVGRCFSVGIDPEYRRQNLFVELSNYAIEQERSVQKKFDYIFGFPQVGRPVIDAHLKSGWEHVQTIDMYSTAPQKYDYSIEAFDRVKDFTSKFPKDCSRFYDCSSYLYCRWICHPECTYTCLEYTEDDNIVLKQYGLACHILLLKGKHEYVKELLNASKGIAYRHRLEELTIWNAHNEHYHDAIVECGFKPGAKFGSSVELLAVKINETNDLKLETCHFMMGSEESY